MNNALLDNSELPKFSEIKYEEIEDSIKSLIEKTDKDFQDYESKLNQNISYASVIEKQEEILFPLEYSWGIVSHLNGVKNNDQLRDVYEKCQPLIIELYNKMEQSSKLYKALNTLLEINELNDIEYRIVDNMSKSMYLGGVNLLKDKKKRFNEINIELADLSNTFSNNVLDSTKEFELILTKKSEVEGLPQSTLSLYSQKAVEKGNESTPEEGPWIITLDGPSFLPAMKHLKSSEIRKKIYIEYITRASKGKYDNTENIKKILKLRKEMSEILNFKQFSELSLSKKMASNVKNVNELLELLLNKSKPIAKKEYERLKEYYLLISLSQLDELNLWDVTYWTERLSEKELEFSEQDIRPYLKFDNVLDGLFKLSKFLFGINIEEALTTDTIDIWHEDVRFFKIYDTNTKDYIASFYLDPYSRPENKRGGAWMNTCIGRSKVMNKKPVAYLICNGSPPVKNDDENIPSLMTFREVETLFHEFGHGLQHMLTEVEDGPAAGIGNVEWDAVELPSQFMENWCYHKPTFTSFARHYETDEQIPDELFEKILKQKTFMAGNAMCRQLYFSALDMYLHNNLIENENILDVKNKIAEKFLVKQPLDEDRFLNSFNHIFSGGYSAGYYSYKWAEVMSADCFGAFEEIGFENEKEIKELGMKFRKTILAKGGGTHPTNVFKEFRGRELNTDALLRHNGLL
jgi:oligopeptidase A